MCCLASHCRCSGGTVHTVTRSARPVNTDKRLLLCDRPGKWGVSSVSTIARAMDSVAASMGAGRFRDDRGFAPGGVLATVIFASICSCAGLPFNQTWRTSIRASSRPWPFVRPARAHCHVPSSTLCGSAPAVQDVFFDRITSRRSGCYGELIQVLSEGTINRQLSKSIVSIFYYKCTPSLLQSFT